MLLGTYKLCASGYPLLVVGTELSCNMDMAGEDTHHSCVPFCFAWVKSEPSFAYMQLFEALKNGLNTFFPEDVVDSLNVISTKMDCSDAIAYVSLPSLFSIPFLIFFCSHNLYGAGGVVGRSAVTKRRRKKRRNCGI
jgi:hypothetical protein